MFNNGQNVIYTAPTNYNKCVMYVTESLKYFTETIRIEIDRGYNNYSLPLVKGGEVQYYMKSSFKENGDITIGSWSTGVEGYITLLLFK